MNSLPLNRQRVIARARDRRLNRALRAALLVLLLSGRADAPAENRAFAQETGLRGPQPFLTILCKFADVPAETEPRGYYEQLFSSTYPGLDNYWREVSYGAISLAGSKVVGWYPLPHPQAAYKIEVAASTDLWSLPATADLQRLAEDCTAAAGSAVEWSHYVGLNLVFNASLDLPRGGRVCLQTDGKARCYGATWLWPSSSRKLAFWAHEMGHAFGLDHSSVDSDNAYGNLWDVMSEAGPCGVDPKFDPLGQHPAAYQKDVLGWIPANRKLVAAADSEATIPLEQLALPAGNGYLLAQIPIRDLADGVPGTAQPGRHYYTVEARRRAGYDAALPGDAVIIHEVNLDGDPRVRSVSAPWAGSYGGAPTGLAARWTPGEVFRDEQHGIAVTVDRATPTGFVVTIHTGTLPPLPVPPDLRHAPPSELPDPLRAALKRKAYVNLSTAVDERGDAYVIWTEREPERGGGLVREYSARREIYFSYRPAGGSWEPRTAVNKTDYPIFVDPALAVDRNGNFYVAWVDSRQDQAALCVARRLADGTWDEPKRLDRDDARGYMVVHIAIDDRDAAHVSWEGYGRCGGGDVVVGEMGR